MYRTHVNAWKKQEGNLDLKRKFRQKKHGNYGNSGGKKLCDKNQGFSRVRSNLTGRIGSGQLPTAKILRCVDLTRPDPRDLKSS